MKNLNLYSKLASLGKRLGYGFLILMFILFLIKSFNSNAQDIALHKSYTLSAKPNFPTTASPGDEASLTDGIYTTGPFWGSPTTVGWHNVPKVTITIDLTREMPISEVSFNTAMRAVAGVYFPKSILVFLSYDNQNYTYTGDMVNVAADTALPDHYEIKKFSLSNINMPARYVRLTVIASGSNIFCDEIEVMKGNSVSSGNGNLIPQNDMDTVIDSLESIKYKKVSLLQDVNRVHDILNEKAGRYPARLAKIKENLDRHDISLHELDQADNELHQLYALQLGEIYNSSNGILIEKVNPWSDISAFHIPSNSAIEHLLNYDFTVLDSGVEYGAFIISNSSTSNQIYSFDITTDKTNAALNLFRCIYVPDLKYAEVADPLVPIKHNVLIKPGFSEMFVFKIEARKAGKSLSVIKINSENKEAILNIKLNVLPVAAYDGKVNANVWAYLNYPMISDQKKEVVNDLEEHHINTVVIPSNYIPRPGDTSFSKMLTYLSNFHNPENILLAVSYNNTRLTDVNYGSVKYLSADWKSDFRSWYKNMLIAMKKGGYDANIYLYPYDEVTSPSDINNFKELINWARADVPGFKVYGTLASQNAVINMSPLLDVSQLLGFDLVSFLPKTHGQIWTYNVRDSSRDLSPYQYYRLMSWEAYYYNMSGVGFWNYSDVDKDYLPDSSSFIQIPLHSYSVIYNSPDQGLISTRRWEAFLLGLEDYAILDLYAKKFGEQKTKTLVELVISQPGNVNQADIIRNQMLSSL